MEHLSKQQLVLLAILISFVTSIATGIVTISLVEKTPEPVTQTINRVVERTIEKVVQEPSKNQQASVATVIKETVVVKSDDLVMDVVKKNKNRVVQIGYIKEPAEDDKEGKAEFQSTGQASLISNDGSVITFGDDFVGEEAKSPIIVLKDGTQINLEVVGYDEGSQMVLLSAKEEDRSKLPQDKISYADVDNNLNLGQTIVSIGYKGTVSVEDGIVKSLPSETIQEKDEKGEVTGEKKIVSSVVTDIKGETSTGSILFNLSGDLVAVKAGNDKEGTYTPVLKIFDIQKNITSAKVAEDKKLTL